ncbi:MAG: nucleoside-diphosphate-sugar epimerase [Acidimicrobiaceae bacterium]|nr:nucleoside-diphosphate-sugar epimerase [Acidimicrobiaceae bacterium]
MHAFITGGSGFVGHWLRSHLEDCGDTVEVLPEHLDIGDAPGVRTALVAAAPEVVYHLAALAHVGQSWEAPEPTVQVNVLGTLNLLEAARSADRPPRVVLVSSAEVYGSGNGNALDESAPLLPVSPYAASKVGAEFLGVQAYLGRGLEVVRARPFNHVGPGQAESFVVSALARRVAEAERSGTEVRVGNLAAARDFTDVRDVVRAYRLLAERGSAGEVYNVSSGVAVPIAEVLARLVALAKTEVVTVEDPSLFRPVDVPMLRGDASRLRAATGWAPEIPLDETLADVLEHWRSRIAAT